MKCQYPGICNREGTTQSLIALNGKHTCYAHYYLWRENLLVKDYDRFVCGLGEEFLRQKWSEMK